MVILLAKLSNFKQNEHQSRKFYKKNRLLAIIMHHPLLKVLRFLPTRGLCECARVCRRFYFLAWEPQLWTKIELSVKLKCDQTLLTLFRLLSRDNLLTCRAVERISLNQSGGLTDLGLEAIANQCPNLRQFEVRNCKSITNSGIQRMVNKCHSLTHLELPGKT